MEFGGFEGSGGMENVNETTPSVEETGINDGMGEMDLPDLEPVEMQNEINESDFENIGDDFAEEDFSDLELENPEFNEDDSDSDDVFGETSSGVDKFALELGEEEPEELVEELEEEPEQIKDFLKVPDGWGLPAIVVLGYSIKDPLLPAQVKATVENKVRWNKW